MSVFSVIAEIAKVIGKVAPVIYGSLQALRPVVEEIDRLFSRGERLVDAQEVIVDDFVDRNVASFEKMKEIGSELREVGSSLYSVSDYCLIAAGDDEFTLAEQKIAVVKLYDLGKRLTALTDIKIPEFK